MLGAATAEEGTPRRGRSETMEWGTRIEEWENASGRQPSAQLSVLIYMQKIKYFETTDQKDIPQEMNYAKYQV